VRGELEPTAQDHAAATMAPILEKENGRVDWSKGAREVHDHVRGMTPWPGAFSTLNGKTLKVLRTKVAAERGARGEPGLVIAADKRSIEIACGDGAVALLRAQVEGKKALDAHELVGGRAIAAGMRLGA
jgi:methionyl-tRNA formyltransferase